MNDLAEEREIKFQKKINVAKEIIEKKRVRVEEVIEAIKKIEQSAVEIKERNLPIKRTNCLRQSN